MLAYIAFTRAPVKRAERARERRDAILANYDPEQREFLEFVLAQYVSVGESELDTAKLPELLQLKYGSAADGVSALGSASEIRATFQGFQPGLYARSEPWPASERAP